MQLIQECINQLNEIEWNLDKILKREIEESNDLYDHIEHCSQETFELSKKLEQIKWDLDPSPCADDYDGGLASYR